MHPSRTLHLKREALQQLTVEELDSVVGGTGDLSFSCLDYISCNPIDCLPETTICVEA